jgi:hypothetical protein
MVPLIARAQGRTCQSDLRPFLFEVMLVHNAIRL